MSETLLQRVARGDESAVRECVDQYADLVWSVARRLLGGGARVEVEDAVQDVFVDLWKCAGRFDPRVAPEPAFVVMIARRKMIDRLRRRSRRIDAASGSEWMGEGLGLAADAAREDVPEDARRAQRALAELTEDQRRVIELAVHRGKTHTQIAEITGLPLGTVKTHARRGLLRLRELLTTGAEATS